MRPLDKGPTTEFAGAGRGGRSSDRWSLLCVVGLCFGSLYALAPSLLLAQITNEQVPEQAPRAVDETPGLAALLALEQATVNAIERCEHSVVAIARVRRDRQPVNPLEALELSSPFLNSNSPDNPDFVPTLFGSGVIISDDGFIVTCAHVLDDPQRHDFYVWLDKQSYAARVVGYPAKVLASDPFSDLAVLKIDAENLNPIALADPGGLRKGQFVVALGNPEAIARDGQASASWGIISNLKRVAPNESDKPVAMKETIHQLGTLIQTDAKLNMGMSGGALVNLRGEMIGLTTSLAATKGSEDAAGFAIATDELFARVVERLKLGKLPEYGFLGIQPEDLSPYERADGRSGARVLAVIPGLPGEEAGLRVEDVIVQVGTIEVQNRNDLFRELSKYAAGAEVLLQVERMRPATRARDTVMLRANLSKKFVSTSRPSFAINAPKPWRGVLVDYATAVSSEVVRASPLMGHRNAPKLAIAAVNPDTAAWKAGLRPGQGIVSVNGAPVESPEEFELAVAGSGDDAELGAVEPGAVELGVVDVSGHGQLVVIPASDEVSPSPLR